MRITLKKIKVRDLVDGYVNNNEEGVVAYKGKLDVRPPYQREFIYKDKQKKAVINSILNGFPLNTMYWAVREDGTYEIIDGQQRTLSICQYVNNDFSFNKLNFSNQPNDIQVKILDYEIMVYFCEGNDSEKLDWFETINIAGEKLTKQELRNAVYSGPWITDAKKHFSKPGCPAYGLASKYLKGSPIRQDYLETAINWDSEGNIEELMAKYQHEETATELWAYFQYVITWVKTVFPYYRKEMKGVDWGYLYNNFRESKVNPKELEEQVGLLMVDEDVTKKSGIYSYLITGNTEYLSIRSFPDSMKREAYETQEGVCPICGKHFEIEEMEADHIIPWSKGGKTILDNCQMLCKECNRRKSNK